MVYLSINIFIGFSLLGICMLFASIIIVWLLAGANPEKFHIDLFKTSENKGNFPISKVLITTSKLWFVYRSLKFKDFSRNTSEEFDSYDEHLQHLYKKLDLASKEKEILLEGVQDEIKKLKVQVIWKSFLYVYQQKTF